MRESSGRSRKRVLAASLFLVIPGFWVLSWALTAGSSYLGTWADRGSFGDMFGAVGALFSGLAFAGVILTVYYQTQELRLQRSAIEQTNDYLESLAEAQRSTDRALCRLAKAQALAGLMQPEALRLGKSVSGASTKLLEIEKQLGATLNEAEQEIARLDRLDAA